MFICPARLHSSQLRCHRCTVLPWSCCISVCFFTGILLEDTPVTLIYFSRTDPKHMKPISSADAVDRPVHALCLTHSTVTSAHTAAPETYVSITSEFYTVHEN